MKRMPFERLSTELASGLRDFWRVYDAAQHELREATMLIAQDHPVFGPMLAAVSKADMDKQNEQSREQLRRAIEDGAWDEYTTSLRSQGATYAKMRIPFASWFDITRALQRVVLPRLVAAYSPEPERFVKATRAMLELIDEGMSIIAENYVTEAQNERFRALLAAVEDYAIVMLDPIGNVATWNNGARALKGWEEQEIIGKHFSVFYPEELRDSVPNDHFTDAAHNGRASDEGWRVRKDGTRFWAQVSLTAMRDATGALVGVAKVTHDLTRRRAAEEALQKSEESLRTTLDSIGDAVIATDVEGRVTRMNPVAEHLTGWSIDDARGQSFSKVFAIKSEVTGEPAASPIERVIREGVVVGLANHTALVARDGTTRPIADSAAPIRDAHGKLTGVVLVFRDQTDERAAERAIREANAFLDSIVENIPNMIFVKDAKDLRFVRFNKAGEELVGSPREDMIGKNDYDFFPKEQADFFTENDREVVRSKKLLDIVEEKIQTPKGERWLHTRKIPIVGESGDARYLLGISEDITEKRAMLTELERRVEERTKELRDSEEQLRQSQKMEAVGRLAGGVAHDFNNLLSVILSYGELMSSEIPQENALHGELTEIRKAAQRAADLTRQLLAFSRQQVLAPKIIDLNQTLGSMDKMLTRIIGEHIEVRTLPSQGLGMVKVDPGQIEQVVMNLVVNARDAMLKGGIITLETANIELDQTYADEHVGVTPGPHVMVAVTDTGVGMDKKTIARIFEPFFTTKETGKGTGLGLSTVFGIVKQSGGHIWVYSEVGVGTTFKIYFPRVSADKRTASLASIATTPRGSETILLVEDEEQVRTLAKNVLKRQGYAVVDAHDAAAALAIASKHDGRIHLLLTDVVMPKMSGRELAEKLGPTRPDMKVLFMSGYTDDTIVHHGVLGEGVAFLQKPITPDTLARKVREVLDH
jgi:PAS domain S-box-containing protein